MNQHTEKIALEVHNLTVSYNKKPVLWDIDFAIPEGKIVGIIGPNGSGKTTLLKSIMGLLPADSGYVRIFESSLKKQRNKVSYVPQRETVDWDFPATVMDVALMGRYRKGNLLRPLSKRDKEIASAALEQVNMLSFSNRQISQLSGGQQQRVFIARSLAQEAELYLMDEPFAGVDAASEAAILDLLKQMRRQGKTLIIVHHDLQTALEYFDWIVLLNTRLVAAGPTPEALLPQYLQEAYGGQLTLFSKLTELIKEKQFPLREPDARDQ